MFTTLATAAANNQDQLVWKTLFDRQTALLHRRATPAFGQGLASFSSLVTPMLF